MAPTDDTNGSPDISSLLPTMMMMMSRGADGGQMMPWMPMLFAVLLPLILRIVTPRLQQSFNAIHLGKRHAERTISCTKECRWWVDEDDEDAYNAIIQKSILTFINKELPHVTKSWDKSEIHATKNNATKKDKESNGDCACYSYVCSPPNGTWVDLKNGIKLNRLVRDDGSQTGSNRRTITTFYLRATCWRNGHARVNAFIDACISIYNAELKSKVDASRSVFIIVARNSFMLSTKQLNPGSMKMLTGAGGSGTCTNPSSQQ